MVVVSAKSCKMASLQSSEEHRVPKAKREVLTIDEKFDVCKLIARGMSHTVISECYGIGWSTIVDIETSQHKLEWFSKKMVDSMKKTKTMKVGEFPKLDEALYIWFRQQREKAMPVTQRR